VPPVVIRLAALFALDSFAGGFVVQTFLVFWFGEKFRRQSGADGNGVLRRRAAPGVSSVIAPRSASRFGLLNTMVFTHHAFERAPDRGAVHCRRSPRRFVVLLARYALSQMDVPARQAFVAAVVEGRTARGRRLHEHRSLRLEAAGPSWPER
jgi:hypothetical protein